MILNVKFYSVMKANVLIIIQFIQDLPVSLENNTEWHKWQVVHEAVTVKKINVGYKPQQKLQEDVWCELDLSNCRFGQVDQMS